MNAVQSNDMSNLIVNAVRAYTIKIGLFKVSHTPVITDNLATYAAIEANFDGYARQTTSGWSASAVTGGRATSTATQVNFVMTGAVTPNDIYGAFLIIDDGGTDKLLTAAQDASAFTMNGAGLTYSVIPQYTQKSEY